VFVVFLWGVQRALSTGTPAACSYPQLINTSAFAFLTIPVRITATHPPIGRGLFANNRGTPAPRLYHWFEKQKWARATSHLLPIALMFVHRSRSAALLIAARCRPHKFTSLKLRVVTLDPYACVNHVCPRQHQTNTASCAMNEANKPRSSMNEITCQPRRRRQ
jgi:hypothetical protein